MRRLVTEATLRRSGLPRLWAARFPRFRDDAVRAAAVEHVAGTLGTLSFPYQLAMKLLLGLVPVTFAVLTRRRLGAAGWELLATGAHRLARVPAFAELFRITDTLAWYGGLDSGKAAG